MSVDDDVWVWLEKEGEKLQPAYLLGHTLDGVFWGQMIDGKLQIMLTDHNRVIPFNQAMFFDLLCELRLFSKTAELHLWRQNGNWQASLIQDGTGNECEYIDEAQMLWGTYAEKVGEQFTLMSDGIQELYHAVPFAHDKIPVAEDGSHRPLRLRVRHYLADDEMGRVRIAYSRLLKVTAVAQEKSNGS
ncbi:MAG: TIGR03984 family CRISPR-associated protein [Ardenticatenaceae bacterium]|nr:TIGR03984 family CRISPR-associated protein [Ardenticatenaceae bacterium]